MAIPPMITEMLLVAAWLVASPPSLFGREVSPESSPLYTILSTETCIPNVADLTKRTNAQGAGVIFNVASVLAPRKVNRAYKRAEHDLTHGKLKDAERALEKALAVYPKSAVAWCLMGTVQEARLQFDEAERDYSQALLEDSRLLPAYLGLARIAFQHHRWQDVVELTDNVARMGADSYPAAYLYNAVANLQLGELSNAEKSARRFQSLDAEHERPQVYLLLADILTAEKDYGGAANEEKEFLTIVSNPRDVPNGSDAESIKEQIKTLEALSAMKAH